MKHYPFITQRVWEIHKSPAELDAYLTMLARQRGACDEVWFATDYGFPPLGVHQKSAALMASAADRFRAQGIVPSMQISNTLGHGDYLKYLDFKGIAWQRMVGSDGGEAPYCNCPRDPAFLAYLDQSTRAYCAWQPVSVWIDDDLRMHNHSPVSHGCFCARCLAEFNVEVHGDWTRESLVEALNAGNDLPTRSAWLEFGRSSLVGVARVVAEAVKAVAPDCRLGLQHCDPAWGGYNGPDWAPVFKILAQVSGKPVGSRPGGGVYVDHAPREMLGKAVFGGLQNSRLPDCVDDSRTEVENLPGTVTGKSARGTVLESTLALAFGCNGLTFTPLMFTHEELAWHERVMAEIAAWRPFWLRYLEVGPGSQPAGLTIALSRRFTHRELGKNEHPFAWASAQLGSVPQLLTMGLPLCWERRGESRKSNVESPTSGLKSNDGVLLHPNAVDGMDQGEIEELLGKGVITDGETMRRLQWRGFGSSFPVDVVEAEVQDAYQKFTDDGLNGRYAGSSVNLGGLWQAYKVCAVKPRGSTRILSHYTQPDGAVSSPATVAVETAQGGRWVIFGQGCWNPVLTTAQRAQRLAAADWVGGGLPAVLETPAQVVVIPRVDARGQLVSVLLMNVSLDATPALTLVLRQTGGCVNWSWIRPEDQPVEVVMGQTITLPPLAPWGVGALVRKA